MNQKSESNRLTDLVSWLRISAAGSLDPHVGQAADAIEALEAKLRGTEWLLKEAKEQHRLCWEGFEALVGVMPASRAQQKLIEQNAQIVELQNALAECLRIIEDWHIEGFNIEEPALRQARKVLGEKE